VVLLELIGTFLESLSQLAAQEPEILRGIYLPTRRGIEEGALALDGMLPRNLATTCLTYTCPIPWTKNLVRTPSTG
jgi:hypothetical protein